MKKGSSFFFFFFLPIFETNLLIFFKTLNSEVNSSFYYSNPEERDKMVDAERAHIDNRVKKIIALKRAVPFIFYFILFILFVIN